MTNPFQRAERRRAKLRLGVVGPAGSGKTYSALQIAMGLGGSIAIVDTEHGSASLYAHLCVYDVATLAPPFTPKRYLELIHYAEKNYDIVIIDSLSHAWAGEGGLLEMHGNISGNSYTAWKTVTPHHLKLVEAMLQSPAHIIATMRSKTEYVLEENERGKKVPRKVGMAPVQRAGMDYEFTTVFDLNDTHFAKTSKDRTGLFDGDIFQPSPKTGEALLAWLNSGGEPVVIKKEEEEEQRKEEPKKEEKKEDKRPPITQRKKDIWRDYLAHFAGADTPAKDAMKALLGDKPSSKYTHADVDKLDAWLKNASAIAQTVAQENAWAKAEEDAKTEEKGKTEEASPEEIVMEDDLPFDEPEAPEDTCGGRLNVELSPAALTSITQSLPEKSLQEQLADEKAAMQKPTPTSTPDDKKIVCPDCGLSFRNGHPDTCPDCGQALI